MAFPFRFVGEVWRVLQGALVQVQCSHSHLLWGQTLGLHPSKGCEGPCDRSGTTPAFVGSAALMPEAVTGDTSCPQGHMLSCRVWAMSLDCPYLDHPYLALHTPATDTWVIEKWTEELHLV